MQLDHRIYSNQKGAANLTGGFKDGMSMGQMIKKNRLQDEKLKQDQSIKDVYKNNMSTGEDGKLIQNREMTIGQLSQLNPQMAMQQQNLWDKEDLQKRNLQASKNKDNLAQSNKDRDFSLRNKELVSRKNERSDALAVKAKAEKDGRFVPSLGYAHNKDDAKKLKSSKEMKQKFDREIGELIGLREEYGVEYLNRDAVKRGKQLSKKLLLTYKNLAKLGVLSKSDEDIVNAIIPGDPLGQDYAPGQDPTLHVLKKFQTDLNADYAETIATRIKTPLMAGKSQRQKIIEEMEKRKAKKGLAVNR